MKIFNRGNDAKAGTAQTVTATATAPAAAVAPAAPPAAPSPSPAVPDAPDLAVILDANVKEMSEKIARLASSLETSQEERSGFEAKIEQMADRMRKLSSLTEMISAQYNPFVGDAPSERNEMPRPEVGLAPPTQALPPAAPALPPAPELSFSLAPPELASLPPLDAPMPSPEPVAAPVVQALAAELPAFAPAAPMSAPAMHPAAAPADEEPGIYLWICQPGFESSMLLLGWADMLLKSAGSRESLLDLVNYYHNIGWIGDPARDQLLAYADGLAAPKASDAPDWRTHVEVHEKSLLFVEKLRAVSSRRHP